MNDKLKKTLVTIVSGAALVGAFTLGRATKPEEQYELRILRWPSHGEPVKEAQILDVTMRTQDSYQFGITPGTRIVDDASLRGIFPVRYLGSKSNELASVYLLKFGKNITVSVEDWNPTYRGK